MPAKVDLEKCDGCKTCVDSCPNESIKMVDDKAAVDQENCIDCSACEAACPNHAIIVE